MEAKNFAALKAGAKRKAVTIVHGGWADGAQLRDDFTVSDRRTRSTRSTRACIRRADALAHTIRACAFYYYLH